MIVISTRGLLSLRCDLCSLYIFQTGLTVNHSSGPSCYVGGECDVQPPLAHELSGNDGEIKHNRDH